MKYSEDEVTKQIKKPQRQEIQYNEPLLTAVAPVKPNENASKEIIPFEADMNLEQEVPDFDLMAIMDDIKKQEKERNNTTVTSTTSNVVNNIPRSMFANCTIQNITFNINK